MNSHNDKLHTPIFVKLAPDMPLPDDVPVFHLLTRDGLFLCRNHPFFRSSVRVEQFPSELAAHQPFLKMRYPKLPRKLVEQVVGFFAIVGRHHASEAAVLLAWDKTAETVVAIVPEQIGLVGCGWYGDPFPMELQYEIPPLPPNLTLIGDMHSHVDGPAYASSMDKADEEYRAGLHIVVGRIRYEPPEFHCEVTVDGVRFAIKDLGTIMAGYQRRREREVPPEWLDRLTVKSWSSSAATYISQPTRRSDGEIHEAVIVSKPERATANGEKRSDEVATMAAPLAVPERTKPTIQDKP
jgi:hypothetical protein